MSSRGLVTTSEGENRGAFTPGDWGLLLLAAGIWGASFLFMEIALEAFHPSVVRQLHQVSRVARAAGIEAPVYPGIMPITNYSNLKRFSDMCGAEIPRWIAKRLDGFGDDREAITAFGEDVVTELCQKLLDNGAPGLHFYSMNQAGPTTTLWKNLGLNAQ